MMAVLAIALCTGAGASGASVKHIYIAAECRGSSLEPRTVTLACADANLYVSHLRYKGYGHKTTTASGVFHENDCTPNCAAGKFLTYSGTIKFSDISRCGGRLYYSRAEYSFEGPNGKGTSAVKPLGSRCQRVTS
jgi:hypothetical protein